MVRVTSPSMKFNCLLEWKPGYWTNVGEIGSSNGSIELHRLLPIDNVISMGTAVDCSSIKSE